MWSSDSTYLEFRKQSCFECLNYACVHDKHLRFFKMYKTPTESAIHNVNIVPENKKVRVLSNISISYANVSNQQVIASTSQTGTTSSLRSIRRSWPNQSFVGDNTKASGHEVEFLKFIEKSKDENDPMYD